MASIFLMAMSLRQASTTIQSLAYAWDNTNRITGITNAVYPSVSQSFGYDTLNRLTSMTGPAPMALAYDASGNRTQQNWLTDDAVSIAASSNQMLDRGMHAYTYDENGNRLTDATAGVTTTYAYDGFNRVDSVTRDSALSNCETYYQCPTYPAGTTTYQVNALGQRTFKNGPLGLWLYGYGLRGELTGEVTAPDSGSINANSYIYLNGQPIALLNQIGNASPSVYYIHDDHLGRPEEITNSGAAGVWRAQNYTFDRSIVVNGISDVDLGLPGQVYDAETGNWSNGLRDYDSSDGRYLQSDPMGLGGGVNTYAYVGGNPLSYTDPFGLRPDTDLCAGLSAQGCMQMGQLGPDYVTFNITVPSVFEFGGTITNSGAVYQYGGFTLGSPASIGSGKNWGFNLAVGFLLKPCHTSADVNNLVDGPSVSAAYYDVVGGGIVHNGSGTAIEMGVGLGGGSAGTTYAGQAGQIEPGFYYVPTSSP